MTTLVLGSTGYLGTNLAAALDSSDLILASRSVNPCRIPCPYVQVDVSTSIAPLENLAVDRLIILARPATNDWAANDEFYRNLRQLVLTWAERGTLRQVQFASTALVYADGDAANSTASVPAPPNAYACSKVAFEHFLAVVHHTYALDATASYRLPILFGGVSSTAQQEIQHIYRWRRQYQDGVVWDFSSDDEPSRYGASWLYTPDLCQLLADGAAPGCRVVNLASGEVHFQEFHAWAMARLGAEGIRETRPYPRARLYLTDDLGVPCRNLYDWL